MRKIRQTQERARQILQLRHDHELQLEDRAQRKLEDSSRVLEERDKRYASRQISVMQRKARPRGRCPGWAPDAG